MARIRSVHPGICEDERLARVSARAERTFVRLWTHLDDDGRAEDRPKLIAAYLYPEHDDMGADEVDADLEELAANGLLLRYAVEGRKYLTAKPEAWSNYQKPRHPSPSKFPAPPEDYDIPTADSGKPTDNGSESVQGVGEGDGVVVGDVASTADKPPRANRRTRIPDAYQPPDDEIRWAKDTYPDVDPFAETVKFYDHHRAKGTTMADWRAAWRNWIRRADEYRPRAGPKNGHKPFENYAAADYEDPTI